MDKEVSRYCTGENSALKDNIRVVKISDFDGGEFQYWDLITDIAPDFVQKLCIREPVTCSTGQTYSIAPKPNFCLVDLVLSPLGLNLMKDENVNTHIWCWTAASISAIIDIVGPGYLTDEANELAKKTNKSIREAIIELSFVPNERVTKLPGLPPAYVYELMGEHNIPGADELQIGLTIQLTEIIWPLQADQPYNAMNLTLNLKVAYQLLEVRIDHSLKPLYRGYKPKGAKEAIDTEFRQVLTDAFGFDGDTKRKSAFDISKRLRKTWGERGEAMVELRRMLQENFS
ncbi:hypothetical protein Clacol_005210 [Clathrus columnatus]|uniref:Uncharacterized protein n=1 Tax=Clathrus columnatus TaxID=1419009 RepID=A0AAV5A8M7_9AGAM|nr:hypothetical protein Clacol_005210 [Clathrus columnatus]